MGVFLMGSIFPNDSPFYEKPEVTTHEAKSGFSIHKVGQPDIVEVPVKVLEDWLTELEDISARYEHPDVDDLVEQMRSYFKG
jgi:hypothetical protein